MEIVRNNTGGNGTRDPYCSGNLVGVTYSLQAFNPLVCIWLLGFGFVQLGDDDDDDDDARYNLQAGSISEYGFSFHLSSPDQVEAVFSIILLVIALALLAMACTISVCLCGCCVNDR